MAAGCAFRRALRGGPAGCPVALRGFPDVAGGSQLVLRRQILRLQLSPDVVLRPLSLLPRTAGRLPERDGTRGNGRHPDHEDRPGLGDLDATDPTLIYAASRPDSRFRLRPVCARG